jgi:hypothetical protein
MPILHIQCLRWPHTHRSHGGKDSLELPNILSVLARSTTDRRHKRRRDKAVRCYRYVVRRARVLHIWRRDEQHRVGTLRRKRERGRLSRHTRRVVPDHSHRYMVS